MFTRDLLWSTCVWLTLCLLPAAKADLVVHSVSQGGGLAGFNEAADNPPLTITFDGIAQNTNIGGSTIAGISFLVSGDSAPLLVVNGNDSFTPSGFMGVTDPATNKLFPTTGSNVLSPGGLELGPGPNNSVENDDLELVFEHPLSAFGFDHISQSADGWGFTTIQVFNQANTLIYSDIIPISNLGYGGAAGAADFWGATTTNGDLIGRIVIDEADGDAQFPDCNIAIDSFRFHVVPEPSGLALVVIGVLVLPCYRRRNMVAFQ